MELLKLETLGAFDGGLAAVQFNQALHRCYMDLKDRADLDKKRSVTLTVELTPVAVDGELEEIQTVVVVKDSLPAKTTRTNVLSPQDGGIGFEPNTRRAKFAPGQQMLPGADDE